MFALLSLASCWHVQSHEEKSFMTWMRSNSVMYVGDEYQLRLGIWLARDRYIRDFNRGKHSFRLGHNALSALTPAEYESMLGFKPRAASNAKNVTVTPKNDPDAVDYRQNGWVNDIKDQGTCGSCWAFSAVQAVESQWAKVKGELLSLSESNLVDCVTACDACNGGMMSIAYDWIRAHQNGKFMKEDDYPYVPLEQACLFDASKAVANVASYIGVSWMSEADLKSKVANYGVAAIAIFASLSSFMSYESGIYYDLLCEPLTQNHGVGCVGYGTENGTDFWIVRNSWGKGWGEEGYIRIKRNAWNQCGVASNAIIPLVE